MKNLAFSSSLRLMSSMIIALGSLLFLAVSPLSNPNLTDAEKTGLVYSLEEAKLAYDLASVLQDKYPVVSIETLYQEEGIFIRKLRAQIRENGGRDVYGMIPQGKFNIADYQEKYTKYVQQGQQGVVGALFVMATVEELMIRQMDNRLAETENPALVELYRHRYDHLKVNLVALVRDMDKLHVKYQPQILTEGEYNAILNPDTPNKPTVQ